MEQEMVHLNGQIIPAGEALISEADTGFLHGASVFTTMLAHNGKVFRLDRHLDRLLDNAQRIALRHPATKEQLTLAVEDLLHANQLREARLRITLTPGPVAAEPHPTTLITAAALDAYPASWYEKGIGVSVADFRQNPFDPLAGIKTGCYLTRILARQKAAADGADEALWFTPDGRLAEACFCSVFIVLEGKVLTPPLDTPVLAGVLRSAVVELCGQRDIPCDDQEPVTARMVVAAQEMFLSSSTMGIRPVVRIDTQEIGEGKPGPITQKIMQAYRELLDAECPV